MRVRYRFIIIALLVSFFVALGVWFAGRIALNLADPTTKIQKEETAKRTTRAIKNAIVVNDETRAYQGYTLLSFQYSTNVYLIDMRGRIMHQWSAPFRRIWPNPSHVHRFAKAHIFVETAYAYPNGDLLVQYSGLGDTPYGYGIAKIDKDSNLLWTYSENAHHDFSVRESDGHIFALTQKVVAAPIDGLERLTYPILTDYVVELSPEGKELRRIGIAEAFIDTPYMESLVGSKNKKGKRIWDLLHTNSVMALDSTMASSFPKFREGDILVSIRNRDMLAVIDGETQKISHAYTGSWMQQHSASFLANGRIMLLDNLGPKRKVNLAPVKAGRPSRILEIAPDTGAIAWQFSGSSDTPFRTPARGRSERLPNGNTLIAESMFGRALEITPEGDIVWEMTLPRPDKRREDANKKAAKENPKLKPTKLWIITARRYAAEDVPFVNGAP